MVIFYFYILRNVSFFTVWNHLGSNNGSFVCEDVTSEPLMLDDITVIFIFYTLTLPWSFSLKFGYQKCLKMVYKLFKYRIRLPRFTKIYKSLIQWSMSYLRNDSLIECRIWELLCSLLHIYTYIHKDYNIVHIC